VFEIRSHQSDDRCRFGRFLKLVEGDAGLWHTSKQLPWPRSGTPRFLIAQQEGDSGSRCFIEARSGYLPSVSSRRLYDKRQTESQTNLRQEDYNAIVKLEQNLYTGGAVSSQVAIAQLNIAKAITTFRRRSAASPWMCEIGIQ